ncbi:MAG: hypothetical protein GY771_16895, partial [bacterium]|nr:hypothetical protein [bacterium]
MKSPLVDALRQAGNQSSAEVTEDKSRESEVPTGSASTETVNSQSVELDLLETGRYEVSADTISEDGPVTQVDTLAGETLSQPVPVETDASAASALELPDPKRVTNHERK